MPTIEKCEDCQKRAAVVEIQYSNHDVEALCRKCYTFAIRSTLERYGYRTVGDLVSMLKIMTTVRVLLPHAVEDKD